MSTGRAHPPARRQAAEEQVARTMQHVKETERLGGKRYLSVAFDESEFGAESTMAVEVYSAEAGVGTSFSPQVAQISAFGNF